MTWIVSAAVVTIGGVVYADNKSAKAARAEAARQGRLNTAKTAREKEYADQASIYNLEVDNFNSGITGATSGLSGFGQQISGLGISDLYDDPNTEANENQYTSLFDNLNTAESSLEGMSFDTNRPTFSNTLTTADGTIALDNLPTLSTANTGKISNALGDIDKYQGNLSDLSRDRKAEESRITNFQNDLDFDMGQLNRDVGRLGISQTDQLTGYQDQLAGLQNDYSSFSSDILGQTGGLNYDDSAIKKSIADLTSARDAEQTRIDNFSNTLGGFNTSYGDALNTGQLDGVLSGQPNEALNIEDFDQLNTLQGLIDDRQSEAQNFDSELDFDFSNQLSGLGATESEIAGLLRDREAEQGRIDLAEANALRNANSLNRFSSGLGIADLESMDDLGFDIEDFNTGVNDFSSRLDYDFSPSTTVANTAQGTLDQLRLDRTGELARIDEYGNALGGFASEYGNTLGGYDISNLTEMDALQELIDTQQKEAGRFSSELDFDFGNQLEDLRGVEGDLGQLYLDRSLEEGRISDATRDYDRLSTGVDRLADTQGIYSRAGIDELQSELDEINSGITNFDSLLDFDFSGSQGARDQAALDIDDLNTRRQTELDAIFDPIAGISRDAAALELYDETGMRGSRGELTDLDFDLARFSGGRVDDIQSGIDTGLSDIDTRLGELDTYRGSLETNAQSLLDDVTANSYYGVDDLTSDFGLYDDQFAEADLYGANIAMDELDAIQKRLTGERGRLETDAANVASRRAGDQEALAATTNEFGIPTFDNLSQVDPKTIAEYMAMLEDEEEEDFTLNPNAFSQNVIRLG